MYSPCKYGWWFLLQIKLKLIWELLLRNYFHFDEIIKLRTPLELPPKSQKYTESLESWYIPREHII